MHLDNKTTHLPKVFELSDLFFPPTILFGGLHQTYSALSALIFNTGANVIFKAHALLVVPRFGLEDI